MAVVLDGEVAAGVLGQGKRYWQNNNVMAGALDLALVVRFYYHYVITGMTKGVIDGLASGGISVTKAPGVAKLAGDCVADAAWLYCERGGLIYVGGFGCSGSEL